MAMQMLLPPSPPPPLPFECDAASDLRKMPVSGRRTARCSPPAHEQRLCAGSVRVV